MKQRLLLILMQSAVAVGCRSGSAPTSASTSATPVPRVDPSSAQADLDALDGRTAVPLLPMMANHQKQNMRDHLVAVRDILAGISLQDFAAIEQASNRIGFSESMGGMCRQMGTGAPGFTEQALAFHHTADRIADAARAHDMPAVLAALSATMNACTGCHATFKQRVVDSATFSALARDTGDAPRTELP